MTMAGKIRYKVGPINIQILKPGQSKKDQNFFPAAPFFEYFLQLAAEKKYSQNGAAEIFFGPSYSVTALAVLCKN